MGVLLPEGFPRERDYRAVLASGIFQAMEEFSNRFRLRHRAILRQYARKWTLDPLHHWSRQWEYPFVYTRVERYTQQEIAPRILDAGSGVTFFPYFLREQFEKASVFCCDCDRSFESVYRRLNESEKRPVEFAVADLRNLPYPGDFYHLIYSISVLEHTGDYLKIAQELHRVLRPGEMLVVTVDISLDGSPGIDLAKGEELLRVFAGIFQTSRDLAREFRLEAEDPNIFTTRIAQAIDQRLIPWYLPWVLHCLQKALATFCLLSWPPLGSVFCFTMVKKPLLE